MTTPKDETLIAETLDGRLEAYDELMKRYERLVYRIAYAHAGSHHEALDLTQTIFLKIYRKLSTFRGAGHFKAWLMRVAGNEGVSWVRSNRRHLVGRESLTDLSELTSKELDPEGEVMWREQRRRINGGLGRLSERYRKALVLRYFHHLSVREVAAVLGCSEGTAKNVLFRGVRRLRQQIADG